MPWRLDAYMDHGEDHGEAHPLNPTRRWTQNSPTCASLPTRKTLSTSSAQGHLLDGLQGCEVDMNPWIYSTSHPCCLLPPLKRRLDDHGRWISGKEELICYLEDGFSRYLQASQSVVGCRSGARKWVQLWKREEVSALLIPGIQQDLECSIRICHAYEDWFLLCCPFADAGGSGRGNRPLTVQQHMPDMPSHGCSQDSWRQFNQKFS